MWPVGFWCVTSGLGRQKNETFLCPQCGKDRAMKSPRPEGASWSETVDKRAAAWVSVREDDKPLTL